MNQAMGRARGLAGGFTPGQRGIILVAMAALVLGAIALTNWVAQPTWTPLFTQLSGADANAIVEELRGQNVQYQLADGGATVMVPQSQVYDLRVSMSGKGLPGKTGGEGWSLLDKQGMTATDFQQNIAYQRALEGELNKTLGSITGVNTAVVRLAIPKRDVFASEQDKPTAAVLLALAPGTTLDKGQIRSVTHLVAGSVPGLDPSQVTVSDGNGAMLSTPENGAGTGGAAGIANDADEQTAQYEDRLSHAVQQMLDRVVGQGNAVVRVNAQLNYDTRHSTSESYLPSPVIPLSEQTSRETYGSSGNAAGGVLGVVTPSPIASPSGTGGYLKEAATRNNGVGKVITEEQAAPGGIERLTAAVILNADASGAADTAKIQALVSSALGVDSTRGDLVTVDTMPFDKTTADVKSGRSLAGFQGPNGITLHSSRVAETDQRKNDYLRFESRLGRRHYEVAILVTARALNHQFEWAAHEPAALAAGVEPAIIDIIKNRRPLTGLAPKDAALIQLGREVMAFRTVKSETLAEALKQFGRQNLVDAVSVMGHYTGIAILLNAFDQQLAPGQKPLLPQ